MHLLKNARANVSQGAINKAVGNQVLKKIVRDGKELHFIFANKKILAIHLMLRGKLKWYEQEDVPKYSLATLTFNIPFRLAVTDVLRKANLTLNPEPSDVPDVLSSQANLAFWKKILQTHATIKNVMRDQEVIRGIGNAYSDEILWQAKISPFSVANKIPPAKIKTLVNTIKSVYTKAQKQIHKEQPDIIGGEVRDFLKVHNSRKKKSPGGATIKVKTSGSSKTYYTDEQVLYK